MDESRARLPHLSACFLLFGALGLFTAGTAQAQTTVWSATLTVNAQGTSNLGCYDRLPGRECSSALTDNDFSYGGADYTVNLVQNRVDGKALFMGIIYINQQTPWELGGFHGEVPH